jgi:hypothetical protein
VDAADAEGVRDEPLTGEATISASTTRRHFLQAGTLGALGLTLADYLCLSEAQGARAGKARGRRAIHINLGGGAAHHDSFDPKPDAPAEIRGEFKPIRARNGALICEHLPRLAACADRYALVRSVTHNLGAHAPAGLFLATGNRPLPSLLYPGYGAVAARELPVPRDVPGWVAVPDGGSAGYLGVASNAYSVGGNPNAADFSVRSLSLPAGVPLRRLQRRRDLAAELDTFGSGGRDEVLDGLDRFTRKAMEIIGSSRTRTAFDIHQEPGRVRDWYGRNTFGQSALLARRLVEAGVCFVTVQFPITWDTHSKNFESLKARHLPWLDAGLSALLLDLEQRGLLDSTAVYVTGEFGRTPKINKDAGRDHWPNAFSMLMAGAGVQGGAVLGSTDANGASVKERPVKPEDAAATLYRLLGIDHKKEYQTPSGRPVAIVRDGKPVADLLA